MNKLRNVSALTFCLLFLTNAFSAGVPVVFFGSSTCGECLEIKEKLLEPLARRYGSRMELKTYNIDDEKDFRLLVSMEKTYNVTNSSPQTLFLPDTFLSGYDDIMKYGKARIEQALVHPLTPGMRLTRDTAVSLQSKSDTAGFINNLREKVQTFTFLGVLAAGLVDGVNPCAIATMIFLVSFLALKKRSRSEILLVGMTYTAAVFATYLLLGIGLFKAITTLSVYRWLSALVKWGAVAFAGIVALVCLRDAIVYKRTGRASDVKIQLPRSVKLRMHSIMSENLSGTKLLAGSAVTGFLVTLLEAVCTGQVYLPTIILMTRAEGMKTAGWLYLIFYNFLFVIPLLIVMILAYYGLKWEKLSRYLQNNLPMLKILLGALLGGLAVYLAVMG